MNAIDADRLVRTVVQVATHPQCWAGVTDLVNPPSADPEVVEQLVRAWPGFFLVDGQLGFVAFEPDADTPDALRVHAAWVPEGRGQPAIQFWRRAIAHVWATSAAQRIIARYPSFRRELDWFCAAAGFHRAGPGHYIIEKESPCPS